MNCIENGKNAHKWEIKNVKLIFSSRQTVLVNNKRKV